MKFLWYEDMKKDLIPVLRDLCKFTGRHLTEYRILKLDDFVYVDNFRYEKNLLQCYKMVLKIVF